MTGPENELLRLGSDSLVDESRDLDLILTLEGAALAKDDDRLIGRRPFGLQLIDLLVDDPEERLPAHRLVPVEGASVAVAG
jgi:hypothetical protein